MNLNDFDIDTRDKLTMPIYEKRYKKNGEEYLKKVDEIDIEEDLKEKQLEINRVKEIYNIQERLKAQELIDDLTDEEYIEEIKELQNIGELDTYTFLNKIEEIKNLYNKMPEEIKIKYKDLSKFTKEYLPKFIEEQENKIKSTKEEEKTISNEELQKQLKELQEKINEGDKKENV